MQYDAIRKAALELSERLSDPLRHPICSECLSDFAYGLTYDHRAHVTRLREDCHPLFDRCVLLFMTPRTADEVARLQSAATACPHHKSRPRASAPASRRLGLVLDSVETLVSLGLHVGADAPYARALNTLKAWANRRGRWPTRLERLLPFGPEHAVARLLELAELRIAGGPIAMLANCVVMARGVVLPVLLAAPHRARVVSLLCKCLPMDAEQCRWRENPRTVVVAFIEAVNRGPGAVPRDFELLIAGLERELYAAVCHAASIAPDGMRGLDILMMCCTRLHLLLGVQSPSDRSIPPPPERVQQHLARTMEPTTRETAYARLVHVLFAQAGLATRCAAPGCGAEALRGGDRAKFQVCARCRIPRYCSKACQARAWKAGTPPHKAVCAVLCLFDAHKYVGGALGSFDEPYARTLAQLSEPEIDVFNAWLTASRDEYGTLSEVFVGPVDVRKPKPPGMKAFLYLILPPAVVLILLFSLLPIFWAILVTLLAAGLVLWVLARPFIPLLVLHYRLRFR
ncbi:hypothetical protein AURDEDRAFT_185841 [Auricularia subglabra TFB-10046 SS5]|nr:hypothetical protein AURDEDRAFT_185841 [Auricularia subglabra TFB-10046 SS5]